MLGVVVLLGRESIEVLYCGCGCALRLWMFCDAAGPPAVDGRAAAGACCMYGERLFTVADGMWLDSFDVVMERLDPLRNEPCDSEDCDLCPDGE